MFTSGARLRDGTGPGPLKRKITRGAADANPGGRQAPAVGKWHEKRARSRRAGRLGGWVVYLPGSYFLQSRQRTVSKMTAESAPSDSA